MGSDIWKLLQKPVSVADICSAIVETREVELERCRRDVVTLLDELLEQRLVEVLEPGRE